MRYPLWVATPLQSYHYGNLGLVTLSSVIVKLPSNKGWKNENFQICSLREEPSQLVDRTIRQHIFWENSSTDNEATRRHYCPKLIDLWLIIIIGNKVQLGILIFCILNAVNEQYFCIWLLGCFCILVMSCSIFIRTKIGVGCWHIKIASLNASLGGDWTPFFFSLSICRRPVIQNSIFFFFRSCVRCIF